MNRKIDYKSEIKENLDYLLCCENKEKNGFIRDRIKFLRVLKEGLVKNQSQAGKIINLSERQSQRLWREYRELGFEYLKTNHRKGSSAKLSKSQLVEFQERLKESDVKDLNQATKIIKENYGIDYSVSGLSRLFSRNKIKLKTGRPSNIIKDDKEEVAFKKTFQT